jgi:hypothetical protein
MKEQFCRQKSSPIDARCTVHSRRDPSSLRHPAQVLDQNDTSSTLTIYPLFAGLDRGGIPFSAGHTASTILDICLKDLTVSSYGEMASSGGMFESTSEFQGCTVTDTQSTALSTREYTPIHLA